MALKFEVRHFVEETHPAYNDREGDSPYRIEITALPIFGTLLKEGVLVPDNATLFISDAAKLEYVRDENKKEAHTDNFKFRIADTGSNRFSNIGTITINAKGLQSPPTVGDNSAFLTDKTYTFNTTSFTKDFADIDGDSYSEVTLISKPTIPSLRYNGGVVSVGDKFPVANSTELQYHLPDQYAVYNGVLYEFEKSINTIIFEAESANYKLINNENGVLTFGKNGREYDTMTVSGFLVDNDALCFEFTTSDDSVENLPSNIAEFCLIPQGDINIKNIYVNKPPVVGNNSKEIPHAGIIDFVKADFITNTTPSYYDIEGDAAAMLKIETLPLEGTLLLQDVPVTVGQEIHPDALNLLRFEANEANLTEHSVSFGFRVKDTGSDEYSNIGTMTVNVLEKVASPPTVEDNGAGLTDNIYQFVTGDFTNNFTDPDGDSYKNVKIELLPPVGTLQYSDVPVSVGFEFDLINIGNFKYVLPDNFMISPDGYCKFDRSIPDIIADEEADGFSLINKSAGKLEFGKGALTEIPNDTDIYAIFDATSMTLSDAQVARDTLVNWHANYKLEDNLYTGNLYVIPLGYERWLDYNDIVRKGSGITASGSNSADLHSDWKNIAIYPPNFNHTTTDAVNASWVSPTKVLLLAFVDESEPEYTSGGTGYGIRQVKTAYQEDYITFRQNLENHWDFFRGVFYPIPNITESNYSNAGNALVLHGFAAIEGGANYTLPEIEHLGVSFAADRKFHWYLDPNNPNYAGGFSRTIANHYSLEAGIDALGSGYIIQGLNEFGWHGVYNKSQPASAVFSGATFEEELSEYLKGSSTSTVERKIIEGECEVVDSICFNFRTSDNSVSTLFSNEAIFCLTPSIDNAPPTVDDNSAKLRIKKYNFNVDSFTKNFTDPDGDSFGRVTIKSLPNIDGLKLVGNSVNIGDTFSADNSNALFFELNDRYAIYGGIVYDFGRSLDDIIRDHRNQGYDLVENMNGRLTFVQVSNESNKTYVQGASMSNSNLCFDFTTSDNSQLYTDSNVATFCLIPEGNINIKPVFENEPPIVGDNVVETYYTRPYIFDRSDFIEDTDPRFFDEDGDQPYQLRVDSLPVEGTLLYDGNPVSIGDIFFFVGGIDSQKLRYVPNSSRIDIEFALFDFSVNDTGTKRFSS